MDQNDRDLWQGGPWEQPARVCPSPLRIPAVQRPRPLLRPQRRRRRWPFFLGGVLAAVVVACLSLPLLAGRLELPSLFYEGLPGPSSDHPPRAQERPSTAPPDIPAADGSGLSIQLLPPGRQSLSYTQIYDKCAPSLVSITSIAQNGYSTGSGVVLTQDGFILTNAHVVAGGLEVFVTLQTSQSYPASLVGFDPVEDLAVLKIDAQDLSPAEFGDPLPLQIGDPVAALGDALGYTGTFTDGIISALYREVEVDDTVMALMQTSAAINVGNSGGPLLDQYGRVVGINTVKIVSQDGSAESIGFAIPSNRVRYVVSRLVAGQEIRPGFFGFSVNVIPLPSGGLELMEVEPDSDAAAQGLVPGDVIVAADGHSVNAAQDLYRVRQGYGPGDKVPLTYLRDGQEHTVSLALIP